MKRTQSEMTEDFRRRAYDSIALRLPKGGKEVLQSYAAAHNETANASIIRILREAGIAIPLSATERKNMSDKTP